MLHHAVAPTADDAIADRIASCSSCGAAIFWAISPGGRAIPMNPKPVEPGRYYIAYWTDRGIFLGSIATDGLPNPSEEQYDTHFTDCPNAGRRRRRGAQ